MGDYTTFLTGRVYDISPEDENFKEELLEVVRSFRTFDVALDEFLVKRGYSGDRNDSSEKSKFIKSKFEEAGIALDLRIPRAWFDRHTQASDRKIAFQFCFAFGLTLEETQDFFRCVYLQRGIDCHDVEEAVYYYCIRHHLTYAEAKEILAQVPQVDKKGSIDFNETILFTGSIVEELDRFGTPDELLEFLNENRAGFGYNNTTSKKYIQKLWGEIAGEEGIAFREALRLYPERMTVREHRTVWEIYQQIFGLLDYDALNNTRLFDPKYERTIQPLLRNNSLIHPIAAKAFPDRQGLESIIRGEYQSNEVIRKTMILLAFYQYWAKCALQVREVEYFAKQPGEALRCLAWIDRLLVDAGYPALYAGNPYDWIFLYASYDECPLSAFRHFMREVYLNKEEAADTQ